MPRQRPPQPRGRRIHCSGGYRAYLPEVLPPLVHAALAHSQFEATHPFLDGNGRVGLLLITLLWNARVLLEIPEESLQVARRQATRPRGRRR